MTIILTKRVELHIKNKIDLEDIRDWDKAKKNSNDYDDPFIKKVEA